jgi:hypothetical protein
LSTSPDDAPESNGRATVALVDAKVATVDAKLDGLIELIRAEFKDFQRRLEDAARLGAKVEGHSDRLLLAESRLRNLEVWKEAEAGLDERRKSYRSVHLPSLVIALAAVLVAVVALILNSPTF